MITAIIIPIPPKQLAIIILVNAYRGVET